MLLQEFGDSARARKLYAQDSDDEEEEELEPNPKLAAGKYFVDWLMIDKWATPYT